MIKYAQADAESTFFADRERGWFWGELYTSKKTGDDAENMQEQNSQNIENKSFLYRNKSTFRKKNLSFATYSQALEAFQAEFKERQAAMVLNPTSDNVKRYLEAQKSVFTAADRVNQTYMQTLLANNHLNPAANYPISQVGAKIVRDNMKMNVKKVITQLKNQYYLLYLTSPNCSFCKNFTKVIEAFADRHQFYILNIDVRERPDIAADLHASRVPAVFLYSRQSGKALPIATGFVAIDELERNVIIMSQVALKSIGGGV